MAQRQPPAPLGVASATKDDGFLASGSVHLPESNVTVNGTASSSFHSAELTRKMSSTEQRSNNHNSSEHPRKSSGADLSASRSSGGSAAPSSSGSSSHRSSSHGGRSSYPSSSSQQSQSSSSNAHRNSTGGSGAGTSSSNSMPRRNSSNALGGSGSSSRDRDGRDRDSRDRDSRDSRDRDSRSYRNHSRSKEKGSSSSSHPSASGTPAMRLRERNNILLMHRTGTRRANLSNAEISTRVIGMDASFMKDPENPNVSEKMGTPGFYPTNDSFPEEKFRFHALRNTAYVNPLPRGFGTNWHLQYSFFTDKRFPLFDPREEAIKVIQRIEDGEKMAMTPRSGSSLLNQDHAFTSYLIRNVRRIDEKTSHLWMCELASGKRSLPELVQSYGVPFKQWRPVPNMSKCPLLDCVAQYRPGFTEATWFIRLNVIYTEMHEIKRDCVYRLGDWFFNPRRLQRRSQGWTDQLIDYLHTVARQANTNGKKADTEVSKNAAASSLIVRPSTGGIKNRLHGELNVEQTTASALNNTSASGATGVLSATTAELTFHEKWSYVLKLSMFQFKAGLLDRFRYFDGLISLLQKTLSPRSMGSGGGATVLVIGVNETMELVSVIQKLLPEMLQCADSIILLVKTLIQHLRYLLPPGTKIPSELGSALHEELVIAFCQFLRDILLNRSDMLVRLEENAPSMWPKYVFSNRFFNRNAYGDGAIQECIERCMRKSKEVSGRILRLQQSYPSAFNLASMRSEAQVILSLDRFHRVEASTDLQRVYHDVFVPFPPESTELPVDAAAIALLCEWAVTSHRPAEYRYLSALSLLEMHSNALLEFGREKEILRDCPLGDHQVVLQGALQSFLQRYEPKVITELTQVIDLFCLLVRRRLFSVESFVEFASCYTDPGNDLIEAGSSTKESASVVPTAYKIECYPGRGYKSNGIHLISTMDRLKLYLWQLPRGPFPLPTCIPMVPVDTFDLELNLDRWLEVMELRREHLLQSKTLERAQALCVYVFHTHGQANDSTDNNNRVMKEVDYQGKVGELVSAVKIMCGHDKGRFTSWFLRNIYEEPTFFRFSDFGSVEHIVRLVCLVLEIVDVLALLEVIVYFLRNSPSFLVKNVVIAVIERHEIAYCAAGQIPFLLQAFVDRFNRMSKTADDKAGNVAKFFCKMYYAHAKKKEIGKLDLPFALLRPIAETARKKQDANSQKPKELSLEATTPFARIPPPRDAIPPELKSALARSFKALQAKSFESTTPNDKPPVSTPLQSPDSQNSTTVPEVAFEPTVYANLSWKEIVGESTVESDAKSRDSAVEYAVAAINMSMTSTVGATNTNATRERRTPNYVFFLRAILSEIMDKWMANITARIKSNCRRPIMVPHYIHRCVRLIREIVEQHPDGEDFQEKFSNTLVVWLQKEVLPGFCGNEGQKRARNPFINLENGKEAFVLNQKGRLDKVQYGLKAFLVSLIIHKVLDLSQVLRLVLVPLFPRLRRASRDPPPNLATQLLAISLVFQLFSEPPQNVLMEPQKLVMFDEPLTKYHLRFMRTQVPACLLFPLVHLLCQISYQMEDNFLLRKREERGTLASITLFNLTSDGIVRDIIFHDTKEAREKHILPVYHKKQWHTAVLLTHFFRPPNSPAEDANGQVQLLKVDQIIDQMNVWVLHRGGSIYLDLQMSRQQLKVKRSKKSSSRQGKRKATSELASGRPTKRAHTESAEEYEIEKANGNAEPENMDEDAVAIKNRRDDIGAGILDGFSSDDEEIDFEFDESSSATEILSNLIVLRTLKRSSRPALSNSSATVFSTSPIATPHVYSSQLHEENTNPHRQDVKEQPEDWALTGLDKKRVLTDAEIWIRVAGRDAQEAAVASLYAATVCSISRRAMGSVIAKVLQIMEDDVKYSHKEKFARKINGSTVVRLICGIMCTPSGNAFLPRYIMSIAVQLDWIYEGCVQYDLNPSAFDLAFLRRLRRKLAVRLQLVAVIEQSKHVALTICYRDRIVKTLFSLLRTEAVSSDVGLSLFSWILDLIPLVNSSLLHEQQFELIESLDLPTELKNRVWSVFPRAPMGSQGAYVRDANQGGALAAIDPWGVLMHLPQLSSDALATPLNDKIPKRRRVFRCV